MQARQLVSLDQGAWRLQKRRAKHVAQQWLSQCKRLATQRDDKKRKYEDMFATEQQALQDFDTDVARKKYDATCVRKVPRFTGVLYKSTRPATESAIATEHGSV